MQSSKPWEADADGITCPRALRSLYDSRPDPDLGPSEASSLTGIVRPEAIQDPNCVRAASPISYKGSDARRELGHHS